MSARLGALGLLVITAAAVATDAAALQLKTAVHVHSTLSTGTLSLDELVREARRTGIGAIVLTENLLLRFEYGLFPFRGVVRKVVTRPSVLESGLDRYLEAVEAAQRRAPDVVLVPGVEVVPYYYWTGSPFTGDLTMWDAQKNLLVVGLTRPEDLAALPVVGTGWRLGTARTLLPLAAAVGFFAGGVHLLRRRAERRVRLTHVTVRVVKRYRFWGAGLITLGGLLLAEALTAADLTPYHGKLGPTPYQDAIDAVAARQGLAFWSLPEARDFSEQSLPPWGHVTIRTDPHPDVLLQTRGYAGFGAIYPDTTEVARPGGVWDRILRDYAEGRRLRPAWGLGEVAYHGPPKPLDEALSVLLVAERSRRAVLEALGAGHFYAVRPVAGRHLVLETFDVEGAGIGGEAATAGGRPVRVRLRLTASDGAEQPVTVRLIRSGSVVEVLRGSTPLEASVLADPPAPGLREYFRLAVDPPHELLSNPIFVTGRP